MTLKYLAVLDHPDVQRVYPYLHVPLDLYVYNEASREGIKRLAEVPQTHSPVIARVCAFPR